MQTDTKAPSRTAWRGFVQVVAVLDFLLLAAAAAGLTDPEAGVIALAMLVGIVLLRFRTGLLGIVLLALVFTDVAVWMLPGALSNISHNDGFIDTALPGGLAVLSIVGLLSVLGYWLGLDQRVGRVLTALALLALVAVAVLSIGSREDVPPEPGGIGIEMRDVKFSEKSVRVAPGEVTVFLANRDLFWHTFTISELDVDLRVPVGGERRISFDAPAGTYEFVCAIPGHTQAGMKGMLTVR
ncbi:MAG: cupredoxin domain-containing protein [Actinomycetota bacterium]